MDYNEFIKRLAEKKNGTFNHVQYTKELPLNAKAKRNGVTAYKITDMVLKSGINYDSQKAVKEKVANGKILTHELPWGTWKPGYEGYIIEHKGNNYARLYVGQAPKSRYFVNNKEVSYNELKELDCLVNSFFNSSNEIPDALTININNILVF